MKEGIPVISKGTIVGMNVDLSSSEVKRKMDSGSLPLMVAGGLKQKCVGKAVSSESEMTLEPWLCIQR